MFIESDASCIVQQNDIMSVLMQVIRSHSNEAMLCYGVT